MKEVLLLVVISVLSHSSEFLRAFCEFFVVIYHRSGLIFVVIYHLLENHSQMSDFPCGPRRSEHVPNVDQTSEITQTDGAPPGIIHGSPGNIDIKSRSFI